MQGLVERVLPTGRTKINFTSRGHANMRDENFSLPCAFPNCDQCVATGDPCQTDGSARIWAWTTFEVDGKVLELMSRTITSSICMGSHHPQGLTLGGIKLPVGLGKRVGTRYFRVFRVSTCQ